MATSISNIKVIDNQNAIFISTTHRHKGITVTFKKEDYPELFDNLNSIFGEMNTTKNNSNTDLIFIKLSSDVRKEVSNLLGTLFKRDCDNTVQLFEDHITIKFLDNIYDFDNKDDFLNYFLSDNALSYKREISYIYG